MDKGLQALVAGIKLGKCAVSTGFVPLALPTVQLSTVQSSRVKFCEASTGFVPMLQSRVVKVGGLWDGGHGPSDFFFLNVGLSFTLIASLLAKSFLRK